MNRYYIVHHSYGWTLSGGVVYAFYSISYYSLSFLPLREWLVSSLPFSFSLLSYLIVDRTVNEKHEYRRGCCDSLSITTRIKIPVFFHRPLLFIKRSPVSRQYSKSPYQTGYGWRGQNDNSRIVSGDGIKTSTLVFVSCIWEIYPHFSSRERWRVVGPRSPSLQSRGGPTHP